MKWNNEWADLKNIEYMIADCWRMSERQMEHYCRELIQQRDLVFASELGTKFLEFICRKVDSGVRIDWSKIQKDIRQMQDIMREGQGQDELGWNRKYQDLTADPSAYFYTELGDAFTAQLADKLELNLSEDQKRLYHDIRAIQQICTACRWEHQSEAQKAVSYLTKQEKHVFLSWLGDGFVRILMEQFGIKRDGSENAAADAAGQDVDYDAENAGNRRSQAGRSEEKKKSGKLKHNLIFAFFISISFFCGYLFSRVQDGQMRLDLRDLSAMIREITRGSSGQAAEEHGQADADRSAALAYTADPFYEDDTNSSVADDQGNGSDTAGSSLSDASAVIDNSDQNAGQEIIQVGGTGSQVSDQNGGRETGQMSGGKNGFDTGSVNGGNENLDAEQTGSRDDSDHDTDRDGNQDVLDENTADTGTPADSKMAELPEVLPQYESFYQEYPDLFGWLKIPGTEIDYPVMQSDDEKRGERYYYLHRDYTGRKTEQGSLFVESRSSCFPQDDNTVIYGHNMSNGHYFGMLAKYRDQSFFDSHQTIQYDTIYETGTYRIAAVLLTRVLYQEEQGFRYYRFYNYHTDSEFQECMDFVKENQLYDTGVNLQYGDQLLMLSTCEYSKENGRLVIVAKKTG